MLSELTESVQQLNQQSRKNTIKTIESAITNLQKITPPQHMLETSTTLGVGQAPQRFIQMASPITTTSNPTTPTTIKTKPRTHLRKTRNNTPGTAPPIMTTRGQSPPNATQIQKTQPRYREARHTRHIPQFKSNPKGTLPHH